MRIKIPTYSPNLSQSARDKIQRRAKQYSMHHILGRLQCPQTFTDHINGFDNEQVGLAYSLNVLHFSRSSYVSFTSGTDKRGCKGRFQEESRIKLFDMLQDMEVGERELSADEMRDRIHTQGARFFERFNKQDLNPQSIEYHVLRTIDSDTYSHLGRQLVNGARDYFKEEFQYWVDVRFKEYDAILNHVKR